MDERAGILNSNKAARSVGMGEHTGRYCETEHFAGLEIDHQLRARGGAYRCNSGRFSKRHLQDLNAFIPFLVSVSASNIGLNSLDKNIHSEWPGPGDPSASIQRYRNCVA